MAAKPPPWERSCSELTAIEKALFHHFDGFQEQAVAAWSELCALRAVSEAAEGMMGMGSGFECWEKLGAALKEWRAICPK